MSKHNRNVAEMWARAFENPGMAVPVGRAVICDDCERDYTSSHRAGGMIFESKAICPACEGKWRRLAVFNGETRFIRAEPQPGESFANFVRDYRGPGAVVRVSHGLDG